MNHGEDPFCDFPLRQRRHYGDQGQGELAQGLQAPPSGMGGLI